MKLPIDAPNPYCDISAEVLRLSLYMCQPKQIPTKACCSTEGTGLLIHDTLICTARSLDQR